MSYEKIRERADSLFQTGEFEQSLRLYQDLWQTSPSCTEKERFQLLNGLTNCQINLQQFEAAYEHLDELTQLAKTLQTAEALYYAATKRAIIVASYPYDEKYDVVFEEVFAYAQQTGVLKHLCDAASNYVYFLNEDKRYEEAYAIVKKFLPPWRQMLEEASISLRTLMPNIAAVYYHVGAQQELEMLQQFVRSQKHPLFERFRSIEQEITMYGALFEQNEPLFIEACLAQQAFYEQHQLQEDVRDALKTGITLCEQHSFYKAGILLSERLLAFYHVQGLAQHKRKMAQAYKTLQEAAYHDSLTGLYNRRFLQTYNAAASFSIAFFDIDYFKHVNDRYGHQTGDHILKRIGEILHALCPENVYAIRYGGDEFNLIIEQDNEEASQFIDQLFGAIHTLSIAHASGAITIKLSMGFVHHEPGETFQQTLLRADDALYEAKRAGRNQLVKSR